VSVSTESVPQVGHEAPDFTLTNQYGQQVTLSDFRGEKNVVVMFYPAAFTGICTSELCSLRDRAPEFDTDDVVVLGVSVDRVPTLKVYAAQEGIGYPLLSDFWPHGEVAQAYGVFLDTTGVATRGTFVIDKDGIIRWSVVNHPGEARNIDDIAAAVADLA
jgi:peroxiredoxin